nr:probable LRR receptor-like serine/threonine-protein kinase At4g37250 [Ipomoea batatas]
MPSSSLHSPPEASAHQATRSAVLQPPMQYHRSGRREHFLETNLCGYAAENSVSDSFRNLNSAEPTRANNIPGAIAAIPQNRRLSTTGADSPPGVHAAAQNRYCDVHRDAPAPAPATNSSLKYENADSEEAAEAVKRRRGQKNRGVVALWTARKQLELGDSVQSVQLHILGASGAPHKCTKDGVGRRHRHCAVAHRRERKGGVLPIGPLPWARCGLSIAKRGLARCGLSYIHEKKHVHAESEKPEQHPPDAILAAKAEISVSKRLVVAAEQPQGVTAPPGTSAAKNPRRSRDSFPRFRSSGGRRQAPSPSALGISPYLATQSSRKLKPNPKWDVFSFGSGAAAS